MSDEKMIYSKSETISVKQQRQLIEMSRPLNPMLTQNEFLMIVGIYNKVIDRLMEESGENINE